MSSGVTVGAPTRCRSCKAPIVWARGVEGKLMPLQVDPEGRWTIENETARYIGAPPAQLELGERPPARYSSHFATCPEAKTWRKK